jgi:hypothetical protein
MVLQPPTPLGAAVGTRFKPFSWAGIWVPAELSAGTADPSNLSHFSIGFLISRQNQTRHGTIDVYLRDDDTLDCRIRDPATTQGLL